MSQEAAAREWSNEEVVVAIRHTLLNAGADPMYAQELATKPEMIVAYRRDLERAEAERRWRQEVVRRLTEIEAWLRRLEDRLP